jgi:anti-sigma factor RsiW
MLPISETELNAYVDGENYPERQAVIEAWLAGDGAMAAQVRAWRGQNQALRATFVRILSEPMPAGLADLAKGFPPNANRPTARPHIHLAPPAPPPHPWDRRDRLAVIIAGSFLAGAGVACMAGLLAGLR